MVWEGKEGGFVLYCRDPVAHYRNLQFKRRGDYADVGIETEATAPWSKANSVPCVIAWSGALQYAGQLVWLHFLAHEYGSQDREVWPHPQI